MASVKILAEEEDNRGYLRFVVCSSIYTLIHFRCTVGGGVISENVKLINLIFYLK